MVSEKVHSVEGYVDLIAINGGGSSVIYSAHDQRHGRSVAIKVLTTKSLDPTIRESFSRELQAMGRLSDHPHIMTVHDSGFASDGSPYLVMPLYPDGSYASYVSANGRLSADEFLDMAIKILSALETAHRRNTLHRDIKPDNVFVGRYRSLPILADFGISTLVGSGKTTTKAIAYTLSYVAPEVLDGSRQTTLSDIYSLGATFRELVGGRPPFAAESASQLITAILTKPPADLPKDVPSNLVQILDRMVAKEPGARPQDCLSIAQSFQRLQATPTPILVDETRDASEAQDSTADLDTTLPGAAAQGSAGADPSETALPNVTPEPSQLSAVQQQALETVRGSQEFAEFAQPEPLPESPIASVASRDLASVPPPPPPVVSASAPTVPSHPEARPSDQASSPYDSNELPTQLASHAHNGSRGGVQSAAAPFERRPPVSGGGEASGADPRPASAGKLAILLTVVVSIVCVVVVDHPFLGGAEPPYIIDTALFLLAVSLVVHLVTWWIRSPSPDRYDLSIQVERNTQAIDRIGNYLGLASIPFFMVGFNEAFLFESIFLLTNPESGLGAVGVTSAAIPDDGPTFLLFVWLGLVVVQQMVFNLARRFSKKVWPWVGLLAHLGLAAGLLIREFTTIQPVIELLLVVVGLLGLLYLVPVSKRSARSSGR